MQGDTEITDYHFDELPALEWHMSRECSADDLQTTTVEIRSGDSVPHTTIRMVPSKHDPICYHVLWWTFNKGDDLFHAFTICADGGNGYDFLRRVLDVVSGHNAESEALT